jgi:electron transfer flavoprotein-quinone oxidoreductase
MARTFDVIVIGSGPAGVTAAGTLAGAGISVALLETAVYAGAENWSGCVYFAENLAAPECFGEAAVAAAPFERKVARRGTLMHNGLDVVGLDWHDPSTFRNCYTVLRPVYDPYFANLARARGAFLLTGTTATSLIRANGRVIGVQTNRGALYADVTFIAEGDASHLVRAEDLERIAQPHFLQGVKAVLSLPAAEIEKRFRLTAGEGAAYEILVRDPAIAGRTAHLNIGAFLYTNRDSISIGYVAPLDRIRDNYSGNHDRIFEWLCSLPWFRDLVRDARLSAYGTKIIRSGGWQERPVLVQDGLVVGGASAGLGIDIPFPNFTGPASATGLYFARAVKNIVNQGLAFDEDRLRKEYEAPLRESVAGRNAAALSEWPSYFGGSKVLFSRTVDAVCGSIHFLATGSLARTARFLRPPLLSFRALKQILSDSLRAIRSLGIGNRVLSSLLNPATVGSWIRNLVKSAPPPDERLRIILGPGSMPLDPGTLPRPLRSFIKRISPAVARAAQAVYTNDDRTLPDKLDVAVSALLRGMSLLDIILLPASLAALFFVSLATAVSDAFRLYVLKTPVTAFLAEPVMAYTELQKKKRDLDLIKPSVSLEAKLATNTYRTESESHIRTRWPEELKEQPDMARTGLWWVCPARVYTYDPPQFAGRGKVTVNYENCIKCESCWRAEPGRTLWGRHTEHRLIYRPETSACSLLLEALETPPPPQHDAKGPGRADRIKLHRDAALTAAARAAVAAAAAFNRSVRNLPLSADKARMAWPLSLGRRLMDRLSTLESALADKGGQEFARIVRDERGGLEARLEPGRLFHALVASRRIAQWIEAGAPDSSPGFFPARMRGAGAEALRRVLAMRFPDREVKAWENAPMPESWSETLRDVIAEHAASGADLVRALSSINPALGLIASHHLIAMHILEQAGMTAEPGTCAVDGSAFVVEPGGEYTGIRGTVGLVPTVACTSLLVLVNDRAYLIPRSRPGITITPTPAIGFRAAGLSRIEFDGSQTETAVAVPAGTAVPDTDWYLAIALGAADYLSMRVKEHAASRVQFGGQMLDTEGRDGIAKLGAVKALVARVEAWHALLERLYDLHSENARDGRSVMRDRLFAALAAKAFGPQPGSMGYDAGQVFGGFAYSEDDLLSRSYRDSSLFRFLAPGCGAAALLNTELAGTDLLSVLPEVGRLDAITGEPLAPFAAAIRRIADACGRIPAAADPFLTGEAQAITIGIRSLLASLEQDLDEGGGSEARAAAVSVLLGLADEAISAATLSAGRGTVSPSAVFPLEPGAPPAAFGTDYDAFCGGEGEPHQSGSFLTTLSDPSPRFVPEMQFDDANLFRRWTDLVAWFRTNCSERLFDGLPLERAIEKHHRLPQEIIEAVRKNKWLATSIPPSLDGLGWRKAEYYLLNAAAGSFGDASIDLLIMASTSIGTTPILLGLEEEMPRVHGELAPLAQDERALGEISSRLTALINALAAPNPSRIRKEYEAIMKLVDQRIRHTRVVKYLAANFLKAFYGAGLAGRRGDFPGFSAGLKQAGTLLQQVMPDIRTALAELPRRKRCHELFLRTLGHGAISAFALTEPTAGSDSGGVKTTATLVRARLEPLGDGRYAFPVDSGEEGPRYLIDADRIVFADQSMAYRTPDGEIRPIQYDRYDYATDQGVRYYIHEEAERPFHDIGQVRTDESGPVYEYYRLTGAKMWITNGSIATQFCLYAQTREGVTGFLVDRHAEGLKVGADERKTGQRGSPTNEISIDGVRVPREAVIGYEGHGQVNALETLNVGRCGLAVVSGALMRKLMAEANGLLPPSPEKDRLLGEAAAILFGSESLAYYLVGLFDRPHKSVRMESAIAKYACSEDIHELIDLVEQAFGPEGQTEEFLIEKARRDSRILTIYEGTNEVQRFLILKDLVAEAADRPALTEGSGGANAGVLAHWKRRLKTHTGEVQSLLGDTSWSDAMLQPALFPLSEMAGEILRLECIEGRMEWLRQAADRFVQDRPGYGATMLAAGARAAERTRDRLARLEQRFLRAWPLVKDSMDMPDVRAADAALDALASHEAMPEPGQRTLDARLRVLVIIRPVADLSPRPRLENGELREITWTINPADLAALVQLTGLKATGSSGVAVDVLMPGGFELEHLLRETAGPGVARLIRLDAAPAAGPSEFVHAIKNLEAVERYDVIATGAESFDGDQCLGSYLAGRLGRYHYRREAIEVKADGSGIVHLALPAVISIAGTSRVPVIGIDDLIAAQEQQVKAMAGSGRTDAVLFETASGGQATTALCVDPLSAAGYIKAYAAASGAGVTEGYAGAWSRRELPEEALVAALLEPQNRKGDLAVLRASRVTADMLSRQAFAIIPAPSEQWRELLGLAEACGCDGAYCIDTHRGRLSKDGRRELLRLLCRQGDGAVILASNEWITTFAFIAGEAEAQKRKTFLCSSIAEISKHASGVPVFRQPVYEGRLVRSHALVPGIPAFIAIADEADVPAVPAKRTFNAHVLDFGVPADWVMPLPPAPAPALATADVIIDVGYGIRDRSGMKLAQELKQKLEGLGLAPLFGATRKVTQDLKLLPLEAQIGQTGVRVNPKLIIALGISGAPQHIDYVGTRAEILCFNKDPEAPLMTLNRNRPSPRVHPILGDLFVTVRQLIERL